MENNEDTSFWFDEILDDLINPMEQEASILPSPTIDDLWVHEVLIDPTTDIINDNQPSEKVVTPSVDPVELHAQLKKLLDSECAKFANRGTNDCYKVQESATGVYPLLNLELDGVRENEGPSDPKYLERMKFNKESAQRSRARKKAEARELEAKAHKLKKEGRELKERLVETKKKHRDAVDQNRILRAEIQTLQAKVELQWLNA